MSVTLYKIVKRCLLFLIVSLATIVFSLEVQRFIPYLFAEEVADGLHSIPAEKQFQIVDQKTYAPPKKKKDTFKMLKKAMGVPEEYLYEKIELNLADGKSLSLDLRFYIKSEETLAVFKPMAEQIREQIIEYLEGVLEVDFSNPVARARLKKDILRFSNACFEQIVVTKLKFDRIDISQNSGQDKVS